MYSMVFLLNISKNICLSSTRRELLSAPAWTFGLAFQIKKYSACSADTFQCPPLPCFVLFVVFA